jgi:hypothetical protein
VIIDDFKSADDYLIYRDHPSHRGLIGTVAGPIIAARMTVQHELA